MTNDSNDEFRKTIGPVQKLRAKDKIQIKPKKSQPACVPYPEENPSLITEHAAPPDDVTGEQPLSFKRDGIQHKVLRNLGKGQYNVEAILDLHGMKVEEAKNALDNFLTRCLEERIRVALVIHGKGLHSGKPVLKNKLNYWLRSIRAVQAFCSATVRDGHRGALYVLLKA